MIQAILDTAKSGTCPRRNALLWAVSAFTPPYAQPANHYRAIWDCEQGAATNLGCEQFLDYKCKKCAQSTVDLFTSLNYQTRRKRNATCKTCFSKSKTSAMLTMSYTTKLISPQEQQKEEIKRGREEQRHANQMRREQMRNEAEDAHEQKSSQALRKPGSREGPK